MTGITKQSRSGDRRALENTIMDSTTAPHQIPVMTNSHHLLQLNPFHCGHHLFHLQHQGQGRLSLRPANLTLTQDISQGQNQAFVSWPRRGRDCVQPGDISTSGLGSSVTTPVIVCYNSTNGEDFLPPPLRERDPGLSNPLFFHGFCKWPGCEQVFKEYEAFLKHLDEVHCLNDTSTAQCLIQTEKVHQLHSKLQFEKERLRAMQTQLQKVFDSSRKDVPKSPAASFLTDLPDFATSSVDGNRQNLSLTHNHLRQKNSILVSDINPTLEYYRIYNVRPPLTYAALIRWAILEAAERQLTLNEIYHWFTRTFAFFRYNTATWKNAVRHNLSLHKCFNRVENVKGSVWTVNEVEFQRLRGRKVGRHPEEDGSCTKATPKSQR
ncbi:forkhead box protein P1-B-like [Scyliorhinus torazame]|uniref:forkhead box protein P1-B-like n=1 Tax=Scyliorhinus torazame TaxID=75743 RepID=UPI003B5BBE33